MGLNRSMENSIGGDLNCDGPDQEVQEGMNISKWPRHHSCAVLAKTGAAFCPCTKNLPEAKLKFWIKDLAEISRQPGVDPVVWLLVIALMQIFNEEEGEQAKYKMYSLRRTGTPGSACLSQVLCSRRQNI